MGPLLSDRTRPHTSVLLATLIFACFAFGLQQTMVIPALPRLQRDLHTTVGWSTWVVTAFMIVSAVAIPLFGRLGDQHGKDRVLLFSLAIFLLGSIGSALAWNIWSLIAFRALQGLGGGVWPLSFAIVKDELPRERLALGLALVASIGGGAGGLGMVVSGLLVDHATWRWLFVVGAVPSAISLLLAWRFVPRSLARVRARTDLRGAAVLSVTLVCLLVALTEGAHWGWSSTRLIALAAAALVGAVAWVQVELRTQEPMVDMRMLSHRPVLMANLASILQGFSMTAIFVLLTNFVQMPRGLPLAQARLVDYGFGATGTRAGLILLPAAVVNLVLAPFQGALVGRLGPRLPFAAGLAIMSTGILLVAVNHTEAWVVGAQMALVGFGIGIAMVAAPKLITDAVRPGETGVATAINFVMRGIGTTVGAQLSATLLVTYVVAGTAVPSETGFLIAFWAAAAVGFVAVPIALLARSAERLQ